ncbi:hypothetical protein BX611_2750 [Lutibacter oceani]|uniref:Peptidase E n=1 Tax=Lutibacter oceani TaxID=1853311 RepID=A0A3D9RSW0_9FLAO|nr:DUF6702 family protein [Lutibacter oceani]REE79852.1 hypothetical protein BX611_2750 [Lutibacter oceani]
MKSKKYVFLFLLIPLVAFTIHKYYISLCEIDFIEEKKSIQITLGMFIDDIEFTLNKDNNTTLNIATKNEAQKIDEYFKTYLNNHFKLTINNKLIPYKYIGKEYDDDIVRFYLEIVDIAKLHSIEVINTCLIRDFEDQQNIIKISANKKNKTFYLDKKTYKALLKF